MRKLLVVMAVISLIACRQQQEKADPQLLNDPSVVHRNMDQVTEVIIHDVFSPPVASRIYTYTSLASYEALRYSEPGYPSLTAQLNGFEPMPVPEEGKNYNYLLASTKAVFTVAEKITFSVDSLKDYYEPLYRDFKSLLDEETYKRSMKFGEDIGHAILKRSTVDNYKETRAMAKFLGSSEPGKWRPTPPDYSDGAEPNWGMIKPLTMDSSVHFTALPPPLYSTDTNSLFYKTAYEVYSVVKNLTPEQKEIAKFWDDNPFVVEHVGHMMYGNKKITPVGHWIGITGIACKMKQTTPVETAQAYSMTSIGIFDGFITCWDEKYKSQLVRPITFINDNIDRNWEPYLQTPPFPEHTSGHSTITAAAATILTHRFGDNFAFEDTSDLQYIGMKRKFTSFNAAALEASVSRLYGGIHYRTGIEEGATQGIKVGEHVNNRIITRENGNLSLKEK